MDLKFNSQVVVAERERRAWSQQHLADAAGLSLRTIQRIETRGNGSYESQRALASCLEVPAANLRVEAEAPKSSDFMRSRRMRVGGPVAGASLLAGIVGFLWLGTASAKQVLVDLGLTIERQVVVKDAKTGKDIVGTDVHEIRNQLVLGDGEERELSMGDKFKMALTPTVLKDGRVALSANLYELRDSGFEILSAPRIIVRNGKEAEVVFSVGDGPQRTYRITFKPKVQ